MPSYWSLVVFTLMVQSAVGSVWCLQVVLFWHAGPVDLLQLKFQILVAFCLVLAGLAAAMVHLGKPGGSLHAVKNFKSSWLSREIFSVNLLAGLLVALAVLVQVRPAAFNSWVLLAGSLAGGTVIYAMTRVYRLRTVPSWNHAGTPLAFLGCALLLGGLLCTMVLTIPTLHQAVGHDAVGQNGIQKVALMVGLVGFILKMLADGVNSTKAAPAAGSFKSLQPVMQAAGVVLWMVYSLAVVNPGFQSILLFLASGCLITGEIIHRIQFYGSYERLGL